MEKERLLIVRLGFKGLSSMKLSITAAAGITAIIIYLTLSLIAYLHYPLPFSPEANYLSDLGNSSFNPVGAIYFRLACILGGIAIAVFFAGMYAWQQGQDRHGNAQAQGIQIFGFFAAFALFMCGIYSIDEVSVHSVWSIISFISFGVVISISGMAAINNTNICNTVGYAAFTIALIDMLLGMLYRLHWTEWVVISLIMVYLAAVSLAALRRPTMKNRILPRI